MSFPGIAIDTLMALESFRSFSKQRLAKFNGVSVNFELHLNAFEWRRKKELGELAQNP